MALVFDLAMFGPRRRVGRLTATIQWPPHIKETISRDYAPPRIVFDLYHEPEIIAFVERLLADEIRASAAKAAKRHGVRFAETGPPSIEWHFEREALEDSVRVASRGQPKGAGY